jgi:hypothetical protein
MKHTNYILVAGLLGSTSLYAAPFTDAGSIYKQIKQNQTEKAQQNVHPTKKKKVIKKRTLSGKQTVLVQGFKIIGNDEFY